MQKTINTYLLIIPLTLFLSSCGGETEEPDCPLENARTSVDGFDFYIENSGSMLGYFKGKTEFKDGILGTASNLREDYKDNTYLFINDEIDTIGNKYTDLAAGLDKKRAWESGQNSDSKLERIIGNVCGRSIRNRRIGILASDFLLSVSGKDPLDILSTQKFLIKEHIRELREVDYGLMVIKFDSNFDGPYYTSENKKQSYEGKRPFYMWIFAPTEIIKTLFTDYNFDEIDGYSNFVAFYDSSDSPPPFHSILPKSEKKGRFKKIRGSQERVLGIQDITVDGSGQVEFSVALDLSVVPTTDLYRRDPANYQITSSGSNIFELVGVDPINSVEINKADTKYTLPKCANTPTHILRVRTGEISGEEQIVEIILRMETPDWVREASSNDDSNVENFSEQTFGLSYLIEGAGEAFETNTGPSGFFNLRLTIKN